MLAKVTKIAESSNPKFSNNIEVGYTISGNLTSGLPKVRKCLHIHNSEDFLITSEIQRIFPDNKFETVNSIYHYEILK